MKIRVINSELPLFKHKLIVKNINFDMVIAEENNECLGFSMEDVEIIPESKLEEVISKHKDILKVKLNKEVSLALYAVLINYIEERINTKMSNLEVLTDSYTISKRGIWEKKLTLVVNNSVPLEVTVVGRKYSEEFSITLKDITLQAFIEGCSENMKHIKKEIEEKQKSVERYKEVLKKVIGNSLSRNLEESDRLIEGC